MITVKLDNYDDIARKIGSLVLDKSINDWIKKTIVQLDWKVKLEQRRQRVYDTWLLINSYQDKFKNFQGELYNIRKYWIYQHEGTKYIKARPWFTDALEDNKYLPEKTINKEITSLLKVLWVK